MVCGYVGHWGWDVSFLVGVLVGVEGSVVGSVGDGSRRVGGLVLGYRKDSAGVDAAVTTAVGAGIAGPASRAASLSTLVHLFVDHAPGIGWAVLAAVRTQPA
uniref:Uncharacterized protein n=1 Tax=Compsopogon caeruleus TaxID=31354 RepID=A0A7S1T658_9RHOD|mmetsp:Transcript_11462/g.23259  ORF Transcript_11462/g.23259 Transcript_11462/m.23259 type:complete len:102 (+) Transcript_11462:216-521(+)